MRVVLIKTPWAEARLKNIGAFFNLDFKFDVVHITGNAPMQAHPTETGLAVLDMKFVSQYKKGFTLFVAEYQPSPLPKRASVNGLFMPPLLPWSRGEWWATRLFWDSPVIQVFANENDSVYVNGKNLGSAFEIWAQHEFSHFLYWSTQRLVDKTHEYFYAGTPEKVLPELYPFFHSEPKVSQLVNSRREVLLAEAKKWIGKDASPKNLAPKEVSCAEGVSTILNAAGFTTIPKDVLSTAELDYYLSESSEFKSTKIPKPGCVIISPRTATVSGHVGIMLENSRIASNTSKNGLFEDNYSLDSWAAEMRGKRGLSIYLYEPVGDMSP